MLEPFDLDAAEDVIFQTDAYGRLTATNRVATEWFALAPGDLPGRHYLDLVRPDYRNRVRKHYWAQAFSRTPSTYIEIPVLTPDGSYRWVGQSAQIRLDAAGEVAGFQGIARDITEQQRTEAQLLISEERYRIVAETATDAIVTLMPDGEIIFASSAAESVFGYEPAELAGQDISLLIPDSRMSFHLMSASVNLSTGRGVFHGGTREMVGRHRAGAAIPIEVSLGEFNEGGRDLLTAVIRDITERKLVEEALRSVNETLRTLIDASPIGIVAADANGHITRWNPAAERLFGYKAEEVLGRNLHLSPPADQPDPLLIAIESGSTISVDRKSVTKAGDTLLTAVVAAPMVGPDRESLGAVSLIRDVGEQRRMEEHLRQAQKMEAVGLLAGGIAHDFHNLLTLINGYSELLLTSVPPDQPASGHAKQILDAGLRASALTRQLLAFSRRQVSEPKLVDLDDIVSNIAGMLNRLVGEQIEVALRLGGGASVLADPAQIEQIILNLTVNARDAMPQGGKLLIETAAVDIDEAYVRTHGQAHAGPFIRLTISDTGVGMDLETRRRIFEPFFTTKDVGKGTGLGLATVYGVVKQNSGMIWVYSEPGLGTTFRVYFPAAPQTAAERALEQPAALQSLRGRETVMVVEDEPGLRTLVCQQLSGLGYHVLSAANGQQALELSLQRTEPIDLLLTDVVMPDLNGRFTAERMLRIRPQLRVLFMSGYPDETVAHHGVITPGVALLQKPFSQQQLGSKVREVLDRAPRADAGFATSPPIS